MTDKIIISDASCLIALEKIDQMNLLHELFQFVLITEEVEIEFGKLLPDWFIIKKVKITEGKKSFNK